MFFSSLSCWKVLWRAVQCSMCSMSPQLGRVTESSETAGSRMLTSCPTLTLFNANPHTEPDGDFIHTYTQNQMAISLTHTHTQIHNTQNQMVISLTHTHSFFYTDSQIHTARQMLLTIWHVDVG